LGEELPRIRHVGGQVDVERRPALDLGEEGPRGSVRGGKGDSRMGLTELLRDGLQGEPKVRRCRDADRLVLASAPAPSPARSERDEEYRKKGRAASPGRWTGAAARSHLAGPPSRPTMTDVALMVATTRTPGRRPNSSTASRVMAAARRYGPASISTSAMTRSASTL